jgi:hypothetical protein
LGVRRLQRLERQVHPHRQARRQGPLRRRRRRQSRQAEPLGRLRHERHGRGPGLYGQGQLRLRGHGAMMTGKLKFSRPKGEAIGVMGPFDSFLQLTGKVPGDTSSCRSKPAPPPPKNRSPPFEVRIARSPCSVAQVLAVAPSDERPVLPGFSQLRRAFPQETPASVRLTPPGWHSDLASAVPKPKTARQNSGVPLSTPLGTDGAGPGVPDQNLWFQLTMKDPVVKGTLLHRRSLA